MVSGFSVFLCHLLVHQFTDAFGLYLIFLFDAQSLHDLPATHRPSSLIDGLAVNIIKGLDIFLNEFVLFQASSFLTGFLLLEIKRDFLVYVFYKIGLAFLPPLLHLGSTSVPLALQQNLLRRADFECCASLLCLLLVIFGFCRPHSRTSKCGHDWHSRHEWHRHSWKINHWVQAHWKGN